MITKMQGVSIVIPTLNRDSYLIDTLKDLLVQDYRPIEIVIVDQSSRSDPALMKLVRAHADLIVYHRVPFRGLPLARNYGWQKARHEAIVFVDDDIRCGPSLVSEHLRGLTQPNVGMVAGGVLESYARSCEDKTTGRFNTWTATPVRSFAAEGQFMVQHVAGCNFSAWRNVLRAAGGFDEALALGAALYEETELCLRVRRCGFAIEFNGAARVQHLTASGGGCRVADLPKYMASLAHNRSIMIGRHLRWFQRPVAYSRLLLLFISYALHYHSASVFRALPGAVARGARTAEQQPLCSWYETEAKS
jgi:GT2 family glycosyltransferase